VIVLFGRVPISVAVCVALVGAGCNGDDASPNQTRVEVDTLMTIRALIGGDPVVTGRVWNCTGTPPVTVLADGIDVASVAAATLATDATGSNPELEGSSIFQVVIPSAELSPAVLACHPRSTSS
jgi:hypothetical protein